MPKKGEEPHSAPAAQTVGAAPLSMARRQALAQVQQRRREAAAARVVNLRVPAPFTSAPDFLDQLNKMVVEMPYGCSANIASYCAVNITTVGKWLRGALVPSQPNLDKLIGWWRMNRGKSTPHATAKRSPSAGTPGIALRRLSGAISRRLRVTARLRNVDPVQLAEQILDRALPSDIQLDKELA